MNTLESPKSFIDLSEQLRQKYIGQAAVVHAAESLELPTGTVGRSQLYCTSLFVLCREPECPLPPDVSDVVEY